MTGNAFQNFLHKTICSIKKNKIYFITSVLVGLTIVLFFIDLGLKYQMLLQTPQFLPVIIPSPASYPIVANAIPTPQLSAQSAILLDADSQVILYQKNSQVVISPASTTKIMTALVALEYFKLSDILTVKTPVTQPVVMGFVAGEKITFQNLLYAMMLPSANDAALAIADNYPGGESAFVAAMNTQAVRLHLLHTHYADPIGLDDDNDYTTVLDLARLAAIAMKNHIIAQVVGTKYYTVTALDGTFPEVKNLNELLGVDGVNGVKTGFTQEAKEVLVTSFQKGSHEFISVVMGSDDRFADTRKLMPLVNNTTFVAMQK